MGDGLAEGTVHRIAVDRRLVMRSGQDSGDGGRRCRMDMGLRYVGLQGERNQQQAGDDAPTPTSRPAQCRTCFHLPRTPFPGPSLDQFKPIPPDVSAALSKP